MIELNKREATFLTDSRASVRNEESDLLYLGEIFFFFIFFFIFFFFIGASEHGQISRSCIATF